MQESGKDGLWWMSINANGCNLTEHKGSNNEKILVSPEPLGKWMLYSFWRLLHEPGPGSENAKAPASWRLAHELQGAGGGFDWPRVTICAQEDQIEIKSDSRVLLSTLLSPERYIANGSIYIKTEDVQNGIRTFLKQTAENDIIHKDTIRGLESELNDEYQSKRRKFEAMLGFNPNEAPKELMEFLEPMQSIKNMDWKIIAELACGSNLVNFGRYQNQYEILKQQKDVAQNKEGNPIKGKVRLPEIESPSSHRPWEYGREMAKSLRKKLGLNNCSVIHNKSILDYAGLVSGDLESIPQTGKMSVCTRNDDELGYRFQDTFSPIARRFQLTRALGGWLATSADSSWLVISQASTWLQQVQRNFAAEFLAPVAGIKEMLDEHGWSSRSVRFVSSHYVVSPWTIGTSLINTQSASRATVESLMNGI